MKITWLGQAGFLFEVDEMKILVDPYLSESCIKLNENNYRIMPIDESFLKIKPDMIILTHNHMDHTDPETLKHYLENDGEVLVLAPEAAWTGVRKFGGKHNYVKFNRHTEWTENGVKFTAVKAEHSDVHPIGVIIDDSKHKYYITGDTLYNTEIFNDLPDKIDVVFLPVNGVGNNMNIKDALRFVKKCGAKQSVPIHFGMFDEIMPQGFGVIPKIYKEIEL